MAAVASACYRLAEAPQRVPDMSSEVADRVAAVIPVVAEECDAMIGQRVARLSGSAKQRRNRALHDFQQPFGGKQTAVRFFERSCGGAADQASGSPGKCAPHHAHIEMQELALQDLAYRRSETREYNEDVNSVDMGHGFTDHVEDHCLRFELQVAAEIAEVARLAEERFVALAGRLESLGAAGPQSRRRVASQVEEPSAPESEGAYTSSEGGVSSSALPASEARRSADAATERAPEPEGTDTSSEVGLSSSVSSASAARRAADAAIERDAAFELAVETLSQRLNDMIPSFFEGVLNSIPTPSQALIERSLHGRER
eukprot:CAMPEP_0176211356 /NCGR_PEP_ID=MMETSP0121_2-20121125/14610_1 /TAXON_ID=160619 /ORGANISM="Kryptoperidinium foliaceum, Strain CCMP 1326" /LENGTH=314 /DNA_ID=CAMNT_0017550403 /DNA_START=6 /DNA_END=950 /DNA_ORIENTATION=-